MKKLLLLTILLTNFISYSQLSNKHWLPPLHANEDQDTNLIQDHYVYLSTPEPTSFLVTITDGVGIPINGSPFTISQGNPIRVLIGNSQPSIMFLDKSEVGFVSSKGLILEGIYDFYVSFRVRSTNHAEFLSSKGLTGAGKIFRLGSLPQTDFGGIRNFVSSFMATEDNTSVSLSDYDPNILFINGNNTLVTPNQSFNLNKGESVVISGYSISQANLNGFIGALLTSDKPIIVNTGNLAGGMLAQQDGQDFNLDQIVPLEQVGTEYVIMRGNGSNDSEQPLVIAHEDNTEVFVNNLPFPIAILNAGDYYLIPSSNFQGTNSNRNMYINSSKPIFLYQIVAGSISDATSGFYFIPPLNCFWQKSVDLIPDIERIGPVDNFNGNIIIATETGSIITINDIVSTATPIPVLGNPNWITYKIPNLTGNVKIESTGALAVGVFGASGNSGYGGYFSGFGSLPRDSETIICSNATVDLFDRIPGNPDTGGTWSYNSIPRIPNNGLFDPLTDPIGNYVYTFTKTCNGDTRIFPITISVTEIQIAPFAGNNTTKTFCASESPFDLFALLGTTNASGNWTLNGLPRANGIINPSIDPAGDYVYTIPATSACEAVSATVNVNIYSSLQLTNTITNIETCDDTIDGDTSGESLFTLTDKDNQITNNVTGLTVKYYENEIDAENEALNNITSIRATTGKTIYFRLTNPNGCYIVSSFNLIVNPLPVISNEVTLSQCDTNNDAITDFNLTEANSIISTDTNLFFSYHLSQSGAVNNTALVTNETSYTASNGNTVWARIETTKGCFRTAKVNLVVSATTLTSNDHLDIYECDNYTNTNDPENDGFDYFNFNNTNGSINVINYFKNLFPTNQRPNLIVTFYENETDALAEENQITNISNYRNNTVNTQTIWVRLDSNLNNACFGLGPYLTLNVIPVPDVDLGSSFILCVDPITGLGSHIVDATPTTNGSYSYTWNPSNPNTDNLGNENHLFNITQAGTYSVIVTNNTTGCQNSDTIQVIISSEPTQFEANIINPILSTGLSTIETFASGGFGTYEYSLDQIEWQTSPIFTDIPNGSYIVYVRDIQGCGILSSSSLYAITYPNFFTPNGDGYNDFWNISNLPETFEPKIYIFDRYGKLIKQINPYGNGWDGTFNGQNLPSTDYWFKLEYVENGTNKEFKSHFSLKR